MLRATAPSELSLIRSHRAMTDGTPVSLPSLESIRELGEEVTDRAG